MINTATGDSFRNRVDYLKKEVSAMKDLIDSIDRFVLDIAEAAFWGVIKRIMNKVKKILIFEGETEAAAILDILAE